MRRMIAIDNKFLEPKTENFLGFGGSPLGIRYLCGRLCKGRHFSLLHHFRHRTKNRPRHVNQANHANPFPTYFHFRFPSKSMQIQCTHLILFCYTVIYRYWPMSKHLLFTDTVDYICSYHFAQSCRLCAMYTSRRGAYSGLTTTTKQ